MKKLLLLALPFLPLAAAGSCASCQPAEPPSVDEYLELIRGATTEVLDKVRATMGEGGGAEKIKVAVTPVICTGMLDLTSNRGAFQDGISRQVTNARLFVPINADIVATAMRNTGIGASSELFNDQRMDAFLNELRSTGHYPEYWVYAKVNTLKTERQGCLVELMVELDLRMVNSTTGAETTTGVQQIRRLGSN